MNILLRTDSGDTIRNYRGTAGTANCETVVRTVAGEYCMVSPELWPELWQENVVFAHSFWLRLRRVRREGLGAQNRGIEHRVSTVQGAMTDGAMRLIPANFQECN